MVKLFGSFILLDNDKRNHYFSVVKTFILTPDRRDNTSSLHGRENPAHLNATFIRQASHEIQGSFFGVSSLCVLLKDAIGNQGDAGVLLDHLAEACRTYKHKLSNFLEYTKFNAGLLESVHEPVNIRQLLGRVVEDHEPFTEENDISIVLTISPDIPIRIISDEFRIAQVVANLVMNAIQFSPEGGRIGVCAELRDFNTLGLVVEDDGEGMSASQLKSVFRSSPEQRSALKNPAGLGLLVAQLLVREVLGGEIILSSEPGHGTRCAVSLPFSHVLTSEKL
jgi:signal transduction histidine kinase